MRVPRFLRSDLTFSLAAGAALGLGAMTVPLLSARAETTVTAPAPVLDPPARGMQTAILAGGCFWGVAGVFDHVKGVRSVVAGYAGGHTANPSYEEVSTGTTGYAESVRLTYDPAQISYGRILRIFFSVAMNPTEKDRQGPDEGTQYRNAIFPQTPVQRAVARAYIAQLSRARIWHAPIVTAIEGNANFHAAEGYHQNYLRLHPDSPYIRAWDMPKLAALKARFPDLYHG